MLIKGYSDFSFSKAGILPQFQPMWGAYFKLDNNVRCLFPYINREIPDALYYDIPEYIQFKLDGVHCSLYPIEVMVAPFYDQDQALGFITHFIDFLNDLFDRKESLIPDYKKYKPVSILDIYKLLPGTNCKECGYASCMAYAAFLSKSETTTDQCPYFIQPISKNAVYPVYDRDGNLTSTVSIEIDPTIKESEDSKIPVNITTNIVQSDLTAREIEVLRLVAEGHTNTEISEKLFISPHTVKSHVVHIFNKLGVNDRTQAAVWASRNKILNQPE